MLMGFCTVKLIICKISCRVKGINIDPDKESISFEIQCPHEYQLKKQILFY